MACFHYLLQQEPFSVFPEQHSLSLLPQLFTFLQQAPFSVFPAQHFLSLLPQLFSFLQQDFPFEHEALLSEHFSSESQQTLVFEEGLL